MNRRLRPTLCPFGNGRAMRTHQALGRLTAIIALAGCAALHSASTSQPSRFAVAAEGDGNSVTVSNEGETAILDARSRSGVGHVVVLDRDGREVGSWGNFASAPHGLWVNREDEFFHSDAANHTVTRHAPTGEVLLTLGTRDRIGAPGAP